MEYVHEVNSLDFKGHIKCEMPNGIERLKLARECTKVVNEKGEMVDRDQFDQAVQLMEALKKRVIEIKLKREKVEFNEFDLLSCDEDGFKILSECANKLIVGIRLGKHSSSN